MRIGCIMIGSPVSPSFADSGPNIGWVARISTDGGRSSSHPPDGLYFYRAGVDDERPGCKERRDSFEHFGNRAYGNADKNDGKGAHFLKAYERAIRFGRLAPVEAVHFVRVSERTFAQNAPKRPSPIIPTLVIDAKLKGMGTSVKEA